MQSNPRERREFACWLSITCLGLLLVSGCAGDPNGGGIRASDQILTAEMAKQALLEMDQLQIPGEVHARPPKKEDPIKSINADRITIGAWRCDLKEKTFYAAFHFPGAIRHES